MLHEKKQQARNIYAETDYTQQQIADILSVDRKTVYTWMKQGKWEEMKKIATQTPATIQQNLYNYVNMVDKQIHSRPAEGRCPTPQEVEMLRKLLTIAGKIKIKSSATYMQVYEHLIRHVYKTDKKLAIAIGAAADKLIKATSLDKDFDLEGDWQDMKEKLQRVEDEDAAFGQTEPETTPPSGPTPPPPSEATSAGDTTGKTPETFDSQLSAFDPLMGENGEFLKNQENHTQPATTLSYAEINNEKSREKLPIFDTPPNGEFLKNGTPEIKNSTPEKSTNPEPENNPDPQLQTPDSTTPRPSPHREGNILWVNYIDDVDKELNNLGQPWGERKMGDSIRRYPDVGQK